MTSGKLEGNLGELQGRSEMCWLALGSVSGPILEWFGTVLDNFRLMYNSNRSVLLVYIRRRLMSLPADRGSAFKFVVAQVDVGMRPGGSLVSGWWLMLGA